MVYTEALDLDEALDILIKRKIGAKKSRAGKWRAERMKELGIAPSLKQQLATHNSGVKLTEWQKRNRPKQPHPFYDLDGPAKRAKCVEMFETGLWGFKCVAIPRLSKKFAVPEDAVALWLKNCKERP